MKESIVDIGIVKTLLSNLLDLSKLVFIDVFIVDISAAHWGTRIVEDGALCDNS